MIFPATASWPGACVPMDWSKTDLGPLSGWPENLRTSVSICLYVTVPHRSVVGAQPDPALQRRVQRGDGAWQAPAVARPLRARSAGRKIWDTIGLMLEGVMRDGNATWSEELSSLNRHLPRGGGLLHLLLQPDPGAATRSKVEGIFCAVTEHSPTTS